MDNLQKIKEWRAEEIAKIFLLKTNYKISIDKYPTPLFDFFIVLKDKPEVKFAIEVKTNNMFNARIKKQLSNIMVYNDANMITIPVFIFKINEEKETGEFDFLVMPSTNKKLTINSKFNFIELNNHNFSEKVESIIKWINKNQ